MNGRIWSLYKLLMVKILTSNLHIYKLIFSIIKTLINIKNPQIESEIL